MAEVRESENHELLEMVARRHAHREVLDRYYAAIGQEYDFGIKMKQHRDQPRSNRELNRRQRLTVVSLDLPDIIRYTSAVLAGSSIYLDVRPRAPGRDDAETATLKRLSDVARAMMDDKVRDVDIGYPSARRRMIRMASAARAGAVRLDVVPGGPYGTEIVPTAIDPRNLSWDARFNHFNDYGCPELYEDFRISVAEAKTNPDWKWDNPDALHADDMAANGQTYPTPAPPAPNPGAEPPDNRKITLTRLWIKAEPAELEVEIGEPEALPPEQWYMACDTCGYSEHDLVGTPGYDGGRLPEMHPCPQCGETADGLPAGMMHRHDVKKQIGRAPAYSDKHRMVIFAPNCPGAGIGRDGPWPKGLTGFPVAMYVPDPFPLEPFGNSDTFRNQDLASMKNATLASGFEQMERNRDLLIVKEDSLWDSEHEPYNFDGSGDFVAYATNFDDMKGAQHFQGSGLNQAFGAFIGVLDSNLNAHRGIGQVSLSPEQMKGIPVGTVARVQETGDVPLDEQLCILRETEEPLFQRWLELLCAYSTEEQWVETTGPDGARAFAIFHGPSMPSLRLRVHAQPNLDAVDLDKMEKIRGLIGAPPAIIKFALKDANVPEDVIQDLIRGSAGPPNGGAPAPAPPALAAAAQAQMQ